MNAFKMSEGKNAESLRLWAEAHEIVESWKSELRLLQAWLQEGRRRVALHHHPAAATASANTGDDEPDKGNEETEGQE